VGHADHVRDSPPVAPWRILLAQDEVIPRTVELPDELVSALKRWCLRCPKGDLDLVLRHATLGHANVRITLTTYAHAIPRERQGAGDALARLMGQSGNKMETLTSKLAIIVRHNQAQVVDVEDNGEVAERLNAPVLKTGIGAIRSRVRISPSPPKK
jgi:hypothetical protein